MINRFINEYAFLGNFFPSTLSYNNMLWPTVEHAYQASKTNDIKQRLLINKCKSPYDAKKLGQCIILIDNWQINKIRIMQEIIHEKFKNPILQTLLLQTNDEELINVNFYNDIFWGIYNNLGENHLGKILMNERDIIKQNKE